MALGGRPPDAGRGLPPGTIDRMEDLRSAAAAARRPLSPTVAPPRAAPPRRPWWRRASAAEGSRRSPATAAPQCPPSLAVFLAELDAIRSGPLHDLDSYLLEAKALHQNALQATSARAEREALARVESCAERASEAAAATSRRLQALASEASLGASAAERDGGETEANLRRQSFAGLSALFKNSLTAHFQAQQAFQQEMAAKVTRQLGAARPDADASAVDAAAAAATAASAGEGGLGRSTGPGQFSATAALLATREDCDELERLGAAARGLRRAFLDVEALVDAQGEVLDNVAAHMSDSRGRTRRAAEQLALTAASRRACRFRLAVFISVVAVAAVTIVVFLVVLRKV